MALIKRTLKRMKYKNSLCDGPCDSLLNGSIGITYPFSHHVRSSHTLELRSKTHEQNINLANKNILEHLGPFRHKCPFWRDFTNGEPLFLWDC